MKYGIRLSKGNRCDLYVRNYYRQNRGTFCYVDAFSASRILLFVYLAFSKILIFTSNIDSANLSFVQRNEGSHNISKKSDTSHLRLHWQLLANQFFRYIPFLRLLLLCFSALLTWNVFQKLGPGSAKKK